MTSCCRVARMAKCVCGVCYPVSACALSQTKQAHRSSPVSSIHSTLIGLWYPLSVDTLYCGYRVVCPAEACFKITIDLYVLIEHHWQCESSFFIDVHMSVLGKISLRVCSFLILKSAAIKVTSVCYISANSYCFNCVISLTTEITAWQQSWHGASAQHVHRPLPQGWHQQGCWPGHLTHFWLNGQDTVGGRWQGENCGCKWLETEYLWTIPPSLKHTDTQNREEGPASISWCQLLLLIIVVSCSHQNTQPKFCSDLDISVQPNKTIY